MKKMICLALCLLLAGCSGAAAPAEPLTEEDFDIYEKGKLVSTLEKAMEADEPGSHSIGFLQMEEELFPGRELETKRGIKIGSTLRDLAKSYSGMTMEYFFEPATGYPFDATDEEMEEYLNSCIEEDIVIDDFVKRFGEYETELYNLTLYGNIVDGRFMDDAEYDEYQDQKIKKSLMPEESIRLRLIFVLKGTDVKQIMIFN